MNINNNFYFQVLVNSWKLVWRNKILWFFGLFSIFLGGVEWSNFLSRDFFGVFKIDSVIIYFSEIGVFSGEFLANIQEKVITDPFSIIMIFLIFGFFATLFIGFLWVSVVSQGSLIFSIFELQKKKKINTFKSLAVGRQNFWQILSLNIIDKYIIWTSSLLLGLFSAKVFIEKSLAGNFFFLLFSLLMLGFLILTAFIIKYALAFVVLKGRSPFIAIKEGALLFFKNLFINLEMALFLLLVNYIFRLLVIWAVVILLIPLTSVGSFSLYLSSGVSFNFYVIFIPVLISLLLLWFFSVLTAYNYSAWTLMFISLTNNKKNNFSIIRKIASRLKFNKAKE